MKDLRRTHTVIPQVLVVEDEPLLRMDAADLVEEAGFVALEASNADDALQVLAANPDVAILFTDVEMPGSMNGLELAAQVRIHYPHIRIIVASGWVRLDPGSLPPEATFFPKPYQPRILTSTLQTIAAH